MSFPKWYIYGAGGFGAETMDILSTAIKGGVLPHYDGCFVVDDAQEVEVYGYPVCDLSECQPGSNITIAVGEPATRTKLWDRAVSVGLVPTSLIAPSAVISQYCKIEDGVIIAPLCSIQARAHIKQNVAVNTMAIIGHDVTVEVGAVISSMANLGGAVTVGQNAYIGMGALIKERLLIGANSIVGMGSVVHIDIPEDVIALGNPARVARRNVDRKVFK